MPDRIAPTYGLLALFALFSFGQYFWRRSSARDQAERWLAVHRYHVVSLRTPVFAVSHFAPRLFRDSDRAFVFRVEVEDRQLGGVGVVWLRVWTSWLATTDREIQVSWEQMPERAAGTEADPPLEEQWALRQADLLRRIAGGESTFRPDGRSEQAAIDFDETVEYILALQRRGFVHCPTPLANLRGGSLYAAVTDVALTPAGEHELARLDAQGRARGATEG